MTDQTPRTIAELVAEAKNYEFSTAVPLKVYLRTAKEVHRHATLYANEKNYADAYVLYVRFLDLVVNKLPKYPALRKDEKSHKRYNHLVKETRSAMDNAERMKIILEDQIETYQKYADLQAKQRQERIKEQMMNQRRSLGTSVDDGAIEVRQNSNDAHGFDDSQFEQHLNRFFAKHDDHKLIDASYPSLSHVELKEIITRQSVLPALPPKFQESPITTSVPQTQLEPFSTVAFPLDQPAGTESHSKHAIQHKSISKTESGKPLKTLFSPIELESAFLKIAKLNTMKKLETCGILCGKLSLNAFFITTLLIPKQESTSNTCQTSDEEGIFEFIDNNDLFVLGWIHTHPTQSCFLSSIDLHTQNSYQIMLPEAVAMVCSPKFPNNKFGIFRLTDPPGIGIITNCQRSGFHPHEEPNIYKRCSKSNRGHVVLKDGLPFEVVDLR